MTDKLSSGANTHPYELSNIEIDAIGVIRWHVEIHWAEKAEEYVLSLMRAAYNAGAMQAYENVVTQPWKE